MTKKAYIIDHMKIDSSYIIVFIFFIIDGYQRQQKNSLILTMSSLILKRI